MYLDKATISIKAGNGGDGVVSFHREKYVANGGPDGGDGGNGGSIIFVASNAVNTLNNFMYEKKFYAKMVKMEAENYVLVKRVRIYV